MIDKLNRILYRAGYLLSKSRHSVGNMQQTLHRISSNLHCDAILDVGANRGNWSELAVKFFPKAHFYLLEPLQEMYPLLNKIIQKHSNFHFVPIAAGSRDEESIITIYEDLDGSSLLHEHQLELVKTGKQRVINVQRIDSLLTKNIIQTPNLCKMDVQGFEIEALKGSQKLFGYTEVFILEASLYKFTPNQPLLSEVIEFMEQRNYVIYDIAGSLARPSDGAIGQMDICFVKRDGILRQSNQW